MKRNRRPRLLILTSSFPSSPTDETCGYIREFARSLIEEFDVEVLAPRSREGTPPERRQPCLPDCDGSHSKASRLQACAPRGAPRLHRAWSVLPAALDPFTADADLNHLGTTRWTIRIAAALSLACFFVHALLLALRADVVCSHWMVPGGAMGALISRLLGIRHIVVEHSGGVHLLGRLRLGRAIARFVVSSSYRVITVSADLKRKLVSLYPPAASKTSVISMGVAVRAYEDVGDEDAREVRVRAGCRTVLFIGRLAEIKGLDVLLRAIKDLDNVHVVIAGDGLLRNELEGMAQQLSAKAVFLGQVSAYERRRLFEQCDAVVIPSRRLSDGRTEGTPLVCLEAMAAGRPVIASRVGGLPEVIADGCNGVLFEEGDHQMLRDKLLLVLGDDRLRAEISRNARRSAEAYAWPAIAAKFVRIVRDSLENGPNTRRQGSVAHHIE